MKFARLVRLCAVVLPLSLGTFALVGCGPSEEPATPKDAKANAPDPRIARLLGEMTLEEKAAQLFMAAREGTDPFHNENLGRKDEVGAVLNFTGTKDIAAIRTAVAESRLKIPPIFGLDIIHGYKTLYPVPLAEAATFDPSIAERSAELAAREARANGQHLTFAPFADLSRDPRWGRIVEGSGEDPLLNVLFTRARVEGFHRGGLATTVKHFAGYGAVEAGRDYGPVDMSLSELRSRYLSGYQAAVDAGTDTVMTSFVALNGHPATANRFLMTDVLRHEWSFKGIVMSDLNAVKELIEQGVAADEEEAAYQAFTAGVDMDMESGIYMRQLPDLVRKGRISVADLDRSVTRVLELKVKLGLFDEPMPDALKAAAGTATSEMLDFARVSAERSLVLLKNDNNILPIRPQVKSIAVIGAMADSASDILGPQFAEAHGQDGETIIDGIRTRAAKNNISVAYVPGCNASCDETKGFGAAVYTAAAADFTILVLGEPMFLTSEGGSRSSLELPGHQAALLKEIADTGKPFAVVLLAGRPLALSNIVNEAPALLYAWYPGARGGSAVANVLFGDAEPTGRLPVTLPRTTGQVPLTYNQYAVGRPADDGNRFTNRYVDTPSGPLFPFGFGLGYGKVDYGKAMIARTDLTKDDRVEVHLHLANSGKFAQLETAQLYIRQKVASRTRPIRELKDFRQVHLNPGEGADVQLSVPVSELGFYQEDGSYTVEPGVYQIFAGADSTAPLAGEVKIKDGLKRDALVAANNTTIKN